MCYCGKPSRDKSLYCSKACAISRKFRDKRTRWRIKVINHYSKGLNVCSCCGESDVRFLTIDHINGGGRQDKDFNGGNNRYRKLISKGYPDGFQVLCFNCNCARAINGGICPHKDP